jgi:hypothetical protein
VLPSLPMNKFAAKDKPLKEVLFAHDRKYRVPRYQRPYAWGIPEIADLWEDVLTNSEPHFVGSVIFNTAGQDGYYDIIDGQQRLLTITILLAALRNNIREFDRPLADRIQRQDIALEDRDGNSTYRILPADTLSAYFQKYIQSGEEDILTSEAATEETQNVKRAYTYFDDQVKLELKRHTSNETKRDEVASLRRRIAELIVISIDITGEDDAYEIFETTNANRVELSVADLLKNLVFRKLPPDDNDKDFAKEVWQEMAKDIEATDTDLKKFIRYYWISKHEFISEKALYRAIKKTITQYKDFLFKLSDSAMWFCNLVEGSDQDFKEFGTAAPRILNSLRAIKIMRVSQCYAFLLAICRNHKRLGVNPLGVIQFIERFTFQYSAVCKLPTNRVEKVYSRAAIKLEKLLDEEKGPSAVNALFSELEKELKEYAPSEAVFMEGFHKIEYAKDDHARSFVKYVLNKINIDLNPTNEHLVNFTTVNIEHLLPQKPHPDWKLKKKDIKNYVNLLGNLTLLSSVINGAVQNFTIDKKLPELKQSQLAITRHLVAQIEAGQCAWGETQIAARHAELATRAYTRVWKL